MKKILSIGNALVDALVELQDDALLADLGLPKGSMQLVDRDTLNGIRIQIRTMQTSMASGGSAANTACGLGKLNGEAGYIGKVGSDSLGEYFIADMQKNGVTAHVRKDPVSTGVAAAFISKDGERTFATCLGAAVNLSAADLFPITFGGYNLVYIEGYLIYNTPLVREIVAAAKKMGLTVAIDLASYNVVESHREVFAEILPQCDLVFANETEAKAFTGLEPVEAARKLAEICGTAVVKVGEEGSWVAQGATLEHIAPVSAVCLDTTGAGDLYASGYLYGWSLDAPPKVCGALGSLLSAQVVEVMGAKMDETRWEFIRKEVNNRIRICSCDPRF